LAQKDVGIKNPVDYNFLISGNFGEIRSTHFHTGIDIKPNRSGDIAIKSIADGYVSRITVRSGGYGNALYIDHPNLGITSVYAHLERFQPHISSAIYNYQLSNECFESDLSFDAHLIPISSGEDIGLMGNTGHSFGRHLHFEIREMNSEKPINPYNYGIMPKDELPPLISSIAIHGLNEDFDKVLDNRLNISTFSGDTLHYISPITVAADRVGLAIQAFDRSDGSYNKNGIYSVTVKADDAVFFDFKIDKLSFPENKQVSGFIDFSTSKKEGKTYTLCYRLPGNNLEFLAHNEYGIIDLNPNIPRRITIDIKDYMGNKKVISMALLQSVDYVPAMQRPKNTINHTTNTVIDTAGLKIYFTEQSLYRPIDFMLKIDTLTEYTYHIHSNHEALKTPTKIAIRPRNTDGSKDPSKAIIVYNNAVSYGGTWEGDVLTTNMVDFGRYSIHYDTKPPEIRPIRYQKNAYKNNSFQFTIKDNYGTRGEDVQGIKYKVWIDGSFVVSPYKLINHTLTIPLDHVGSGEHVLKIIATDHSGNEGVFEGIFKR
jgi:murein DD-endopeptidase MepM/ murein hydrolase activator NlpD